MMGFRDMTFCRGDGCLAFDRCPRALNDQVKAAAAKWWGGDDFPIVQWANPSAQNCYEPPTKNEP